MPREVSGILISFQFCLSLGWDRGVNDRIAELEKQRSDQQKRMEDLQKENIELANLQEVKLEANISATDEPISPTSPMDKLAADTLKLPGERDASLSRIWW